MLGQAAVAQPIFDAMYFVRGEVSRNGAPNPVDGRTVVVYSSYPTGARIRVGPPFSASGYYELNIFDNEDFRPVSGTTYYVAIEQDPTLDTWGADPVPFTLTTEGWNRVNLTLTDGGGPGGVTEGPDDGLINGSTISRLDSGAIRLDWSYNGAINAVIWRMEADPATDEFSNNTDLYGSGPVAGPFTLAAGETTWTDPDTHTGDGRTFYYRIVPDGVARADIFGTDGGGMAYNRRTLGKTDLSLVEGYNLLCYPFNSATIDIPTLIGNQLLIGDQIHWWNLGAGIGTQGYMLTTRLTAGTTSDHWSAPHNFQFGEGFFIYIVPGPDLVPALPSRGSVQLTFVGLVDNFATGLQIPLVREYNLIGYPCPVVRTVNAAGFVPREQDQVHIWYPDASRIPPPPPARSAQAFWISTLVGSDWNYPDAVNLTVGEGKFYYIPTDSASYDWTLTLPRY
ncbi:MAG: hypothetical protein JW782_01105 [Candidatus Saganbacteria bacterium]|nr:hypothetical protein [Candidatus Saganbacteria bacterium]